MDTQGTRLMGIITALRHDVIRVSPHLGYSDAEILAKDAELVIDACGFLLDALRDALGISPEEVGRIMHASWSNTKKAQGYHGPNAPCTTGLCDDPRQFVTHCVRYHADLVPWDALPEAQKDINRHAFDAVLEEMRARVILRFRGKGY